MHNKFYARKITGWAAGVFLCLILCGCARDKALELSVGTREAAAEGGAETGADARGSDAEEGDAAEGFGGTIFVHVCGAVLSPQVVELPAGSRGYEAVLAAGGFAGEAAQDAVNLAEKLADGTQLYIPTIEERETLAATEREAESGLVNINKADAAGLCTLPGIGEARAGAIIAYREENGEFQSPEDIMRVPGIKESAYAKIKDKISVK